MQASGRKERLFERLTFIHLQATQCSLDVRRQQLPTENETADRRDPAYCGENYRKKGNAPGNKQKAIMKAIVSNPSAMPAK